jgi:hypothetical protein
LEKAKNEELLKTIELNQKRHKKELENVKLLHAQELYMLKKKLSSKEKEKE